MKDILSKIAFGFIFGIGLSVAVFVSFFAVEKITSISANQTYKNFDSESGLIITDQHERKINDGVAVLGAVENTGTDSWRYIKLEAEIYDKNGVFIEECSENIDRLLAPSQKENFKITCGGCSNNKIPEHGNISVKITSASHVPDNDK